MNVWIMLACASTLHSVTNNYGREEFALHVWMFLQKPEGLRHSRHGRMAPGVHRYIVEDLIGSYRGRITGTAGDSVQDAIEIVTKAVGLDSLRLS
jgi:hypothetical protein